MGTDNHWGDTDMNDMDKEHEAERLEEYLEFERHLERLQQEKRPRRPRRMTPGQAKAYQMAALFRAAAPDAAEPDPAFAARLEAQLEGKLKARGALDAVIAPRAAFGQCITSISAGWWSFRSSRTGCRGGAGWGDGAET